MSRLAEILQQEYKTKGIIGGATSTLGKRALEKIDIRNALFGGAGVGSVIGTKIFGKGYSATRRTGADKTTSPINESLSSGASPLLQEININSKITAKNSMSLPPMAKQMNIMQKNIAKLVKVWGGTPTTKADSFFSNSKFRENQYESQFNSGKKPIKTEAVKEKSSSGLLGMIGSLAGGIMSLIGGIASSISAIVSGLAAIPAVLATLGASAAALGTAFMTVLNFLARSPIGRLLGLVGIAVGGAVAASKIFGSETDESGGKYSTGEKVGYTAAGAVGAAMGVSSIKKNLTPPAKTPGALSDFGEVGAKRAAAQTKWGRFLIFLEKKAPRLFARIGVKLAAMGGLAAVPIAGWVGALITAGFLVWDIVFLFDMWTEFSGSSEESNTKSPTPKPLDISENTYDSMGNITGTTTSPSKVPSSGTKTSNTTTPTGQSSVRDKQQIEAYLGKAISDREYDALLRTVGAEAGKDPIERAAVASVILNRAKKIGGDIIATLNAPGQFQAITGPDGKGSVDNPWSPNAKKIIPGIEKDISSNIASVPKGLDSFTSAIPSAYGAVGGQRKFEQKMAEMSSLGGTKIGQSVFASAGVSATQIAGSPKINGTTVASASQSINSSGTGQNMFTPEDLAALANVMGSQTMINGGGGLKEVITASKSTPYEKEFYSNMVNKIAL